MYERYSEKNIKSENEVLNRLLFHYMLIFKNACIVDRIICCNRS